MSLRVAGALLLLLAAACAAGCSRSGVRQKNAPPASAVSATDLRRGEAVYSAQCSACHGERGIGGQIGPSLHNEYARRSYRSVYLLVRDPAPPMPKLYPARMTLRELRDVSAYVETL